MNKSTTVKRNFTLNLVFLIVAYVAIVAGIGYWVWINTLKFENEAIGRTQQQLLTIAKAESKNIEGFINATLFDSKMLTKDPLVIKYLKDDLKAKSTPEANYYTYEYLFEQFGGKVDFIHWLNAKGIVLGGFPFVEEIIGRDESRDPDVKIILENHNSRIGVIEANPGKKFLCICNSVIENGNFLGLTRVLVSLDTINSLVSTIRAGEKGYAWVISEQGIMMAHPKPEHRGIDIMAIRKKAFPDFDWSELEDIVDKMESGEEGVDTYQSAWWTEEKLKIVRKLTAFSPINISAGQELWSIGVSLSYDEIAGPIKRNALNNFIGAGALLLAFSIGGIILFRVQRKSAEIEIIARSAEELRSLNTKLQAEITARKKMEEQIMASLKEKEELLKEVHHRVKNNLQIISGLLYMSGNRAKSQEAIDLLTEASNRIDSIALIHTQLYQSENFDRINLEEHIQEISNNLLQIYAEEKRVKLNITHSDVHLPVSQAIPCALVMNEIITNALKYGFNGQKEGTISISMKMEDDERIVIKIKDDGVGIPEDIDIYKTDSLGQKLIRNITEEQLKGKVMFNRSNGTEFIVEFNVLREEVDKVK